MIKSNKKNSGRRRNTLKPKLVSKRRKHLCTLRVSLMHIIIVHVFTFRLKCSQCICDHFSTIYTNFTPFHVDVTLTNFPNKFTVDSFLFCNSINSDHWCISNIL